VAVKPMLDDLELQLVQQIEADEHQVRAQHAVPTLEGDFLQALGRRAERITLNGILTAVDEEAENVSEKLKKLREKFRAAQPVPFAADIATATKIDTVLIEEMSVRELAGKPERFEYAFAVREYIPAPPPEEEKPPPPPEPLVTTLIVEVIVEGQPGFDFSKVTVTVEGHKEDGSNHKATLTNRTDNVWTEENFPPGSYTARAVVTGPPAMSGSEQVQVQEAQKAKVTIVLRPGSVGAVALAYVVHYWFDKAFIEPCLRPVLREVAQRAAGNEKLLIVGHTDLVGDDNYNRALSERRARGVYAFLTFGKDADTSVAEWNELRKTRKADPNALLNDNWGVREYQYMLQDLGFYVGPINEDNNESDDNTKAAVRAFQEAKGLTVDGKVGDETWPVLIREYLAQDNLSVDESRFFSTAKDGCDSGPLKWLGCGEKDPVDNRDVAWRPNRRTEMLFISADKLPDSDCEVPKPVTFDIRLDGSTPGKWCLGNGNPNQPLCFLTRESEKPNKFLVQSAHPEKVQVSGQITFEDGTPFAKKHYVLIAPDGEFLHTGEKGKADKKGERPSGTQRGRPNFSKTDEEGRFSHPEDTPTGIYILELPDLNIPQVARAEVDPPSEARGNVVCLNINESAVGSQFEDKPGAPAAKGKVKVQPAGIPGANVTPTVNLESKVVVVPKPHTHPTMKMVTLKTDKTFNGTGTFTVSGNKDAVKFFKDKAGTIEMKFDNTDNVYTGDQLFAGVQVFVGARKHSGTMEDIVLNLALDPGKKKGTAKMTAIEVNLDICGIQTTAGGSPPVMSEADKINIGRFVQLQDGAGNAGRALLIIRKVIPAAFRGTLVVTPLDARVQVFKTERGGAAEVTPIEITNPAIPPGGSNFFVQGASVSSALHDTGLRLGVKQDGKDIELEADRVAITVAQFTQIRAIIRPTPPNSVRAGFAAPANHTFDATSISEDFAVNVPLVLIRNAQPDINLELTCAPAGLPIRWQAVRNPQDHASLGNAANIPGVTPNAVNRLLAVLNANNRGSFRIRAYIDTNGSNTYQAGEPSMPLNLVLAEATVVADNSAAHPATLSVAFDGAGGFGITNGSWTAGLPGAGMAMELIADVTGGGADGRLGLDRVFSGLVNMVQVRDVIGTYRDTTVVPPTDQHLSFIAATNIAGLPASFAGRPLFRPNPPTADPPPILHLLPLLDTGRAAPGTGGETATMTRSGPHVAVPRPVGQRWTIQCMDSPGFTFPRAHPVNVNAILRQAHYHYQFIACFCFWTNINRNRGVSNDPSERTYSVLRIVNWEIVGDWNINYPPAPAAPVSVPTTAHNIRITARTTVNPIGRAQDNRVELRPPSGILIAAFDGSR